MKAIDNLVRTIINKVNSMSAHRTKKLDLTGEQSSMVAKVQRVSEDSYIAHRVPTWLARDMRLHLAQKVAETKYKNIFDYEYLEDLHRADDNVLMFPVNVLSHKEVRKCLVCSPRLFYQETKGQMAKVLEKAIDGYTGGYPDRIKLCTCNEHDYSILLTGGKDIIILSHNTQKGSYRLQPLLISVCDVDPINITNFRFMYCNDVNLPAGSISANLLWIIEQVVLGLIKAGAVVEFVSKNTMMTKFEMNDSDEQ